MISCMLVYHPKPLGTNNKRVISTFKFGYPRLTLKEGSKVKSDHTKSPCLKSKNARGSHLVFQNEAKNIPRQDFMAMNISCKFEKASYNIFFVRVVMVKSLYTLRWRLRRRHNKVKSIVSTGCYPVDTITV